MDVKTGALRGVAWTSLSFGFRQAFQTIVTVLLARVLLPEHYGVVAVAALAIAVLSLFRNLGLNVALVRAPDPTPTDLSSAFWFNSAVGLVLTSVLAISAPAVAWFFGEPRVVPVLLLLAPTFLLTSFTQVHGALLQRSRNYRRFAVRETAAVVLGGVVSIGMAYAGFGLYSLVAQSIASALFSILFLWTSVDWRPKLLFSWASLRELLGFGLPVAGSNALNFLSRNLDNILVGRFLGITALGLYGFSYAIIQTPIAAIQSILGRVMFPELSRIQQDLPHVRAVYLGSLRYIAAALWLPLGGFVVLAPVFVPTVLSERWVPAVFLLQVFTIVAIGQVIGTTVGWLYHSQGRTRLQFWIGLAYNLVVYAGFVVGLQWGLRGVALSYLVVNLVLGIPFNRVAFRIVHLRGLDVLRSLGSSLAALAQLVATLLIVVEACRRWDVEPWTTLGLGAALGTAVYVLVLWLIDPGLVRGLLRLPADLRRGASA